MRYMRKLLKKKDVSFIEPSIDTGVFYSAFLEEFAESTKHVLGFGIDSHYYNPTKKFWEETLSNCKVVEAQHLKSIHIMSILFLYSSVIPSSRFF